MKNIPYGRQWIDEEDLSAVLNTLQSDFLTQGPKIGEFERKLAQYCGAKYAVVFSSGTSALHAAYHALGLKKNDEFITSPISFVATANAGLYLGARPVFVDVEKETGNIDPQEIEKAITDKTKLIVPVHYAGHPTDLQRIREIANKYKLSVIEDACHALGAEYGIRQKNDNTMKFVRIGGCHYSEMAVLSFHPVKHITTGEGGAVLTNNNEHYEKLLLFRNHGITKDASKYKNFQSQVPGEWYHEMHLLGFNYRMTDIQAALGISQLNKLDKFVSLRREIAQKYNDAFRCSPYFEIPIEKEYAKSSYHLYHIRLKDPYRMKKSEIFSDLRNKGLGVQVHYIPIYLEPYYQTLGYEKGICPIAEEFYEREISIQIYPGMTDDDISYVISILTEDFQFLG